MNYQIHEIEEEKYHAGTKAPNDVFNIVNTLDFKPISFYLKSYTIKFFGKYISQFRYKLIWDKIYNQIEDNSTILLQHTYRFRQDEREVVLRKLKDNKHCKFIVLIHDVEELRGHFTDEYHKQQFNLSLELADMLIVHNKIMKDWFISKGIDENKLVTLEIFDYLSKVEINKMSFSNSVTIAGNLNVSKVKYLSSINKIKDINFDLYGGGWNSLKKYSNITYHGSFFPDDLPRQFEKGFGLIWDGDSIKTCSGPFGNYLRYNNPHKLSLYLTSGLPVIIWSQSAEASFVRNNNLGICVDSLTEIGSKINKLTSDEYNIMANNVLELSKKLRDGYFTKKAINECLGRLGK